MATGLGSACDRTPLLGRLPCVPRWLCCGSPCSRNEPWPLPRQWSGVDLPSILLLDLKHLFLTRPVASVSNMFSFPDMQILALFAPFGECF